MNTGNEMDTMDDVPQVKSRTGLYAVLVLLAIIGVCGILWLLNKYATVPSNQLTKPAAGEVQESTEEPAK